jgi:probable HAF family extracellular repeat protein
VFKKHCSMLYVLEAALVLGTICSPSNVLSAEARYSIQDLGDLGLASSPQSWANAINDQGQVVGGSYAATSGENVLFHAFLWSKETGMLDLGTAGYFNSGALSLNNAANVAGYVVTGPPQYQYHTTFAAQWTQSPSGAYSPTIIDTIGVASGINDCGQVVYNNVRNGQVCGTLWENGTRTNIPFYPEDINNQGEVVGWVAKGAYVWNKSSGATALPLLPQCSEASAYAINETGVVVGSEGTGTNNRQACLWRMGQPALLGAFGNYSYASDINDNNEVVGTTATSAGEAAFIWTAGGGMELLTSLLQPESGWQLMSATAINQKGQIVGQGISPEGHMHAYLCTPIPEPSTFALLGIGAIGVLAYGWCRRRI